MLSTNNQYNVRANVPNPKSEPKCFTIYYYKFISTDTRLESKMTGETYPSTQQPPFVHLLKSPRRSSRRTPKPRPSPTTTETWRYTSPPGKKAHLTSRNSSSKSTPRAQHKRTTTETCHSTTPHTTMHPSRW